MAKISFSNLTKDISHEVEDLGKFENDLNKLYDKWETKNPEIFSNFRPVILNEDKNEIIFNEDFFNDWENSIPYTEENKYKFAFIIQGGDGFVSFYKLKKDVNWGTDVEGSFDESIGTYSRTFNAEVAHLTNDIMKLLGELAQMDFYFSVSDSSSSEDYHIMLETDDEEDCPLVTFDAKLK
jgi:hypothetical protein